MAARSSACAPSSSSPPSLWKAICSRAPKELAEAPWGARLPGICSGLGKRNHKLPQTKQAHSQAACLAAVPGLEALQGEQAGDLRWGPALAPEHPASSAACTAHTPRELPLSSAPPASWMGMGMLGRVVVGWAGPV